MSTAIAPDIECSECHQEYGESFIHTLRTNSEPACEHCSECCTGCAEWFPNDSVAEDGVTVVKHVVFIDRLPWCRVCAREVLDAMYEEWRADKRAMCQCGSYPIEPTKAGEDYIGTCGICAGIGGEAGSIREAEEWLKSLLHVSERVLQEGRMGSSSTHAPSTSLPVSGGTSAGPGAAVDSSASRPEISPCGDQTQLISTLPGARYDQGASPDFSEVER